MHISVHKLNCTVWFNLAASLHFTWMQIHTRPTKGEGCQACQWQKSKCKCTTKYIRLSTCESLSSRASYRQSKCVSVQCHCWQTGHIGGAGGGSSHTILAPEPGTDMAQASDQGGPVYWGCQTAGVYVNVYGICLYACSKSWARSLPSSVSGFRPGH